MSSHIAIEMFYAEFESSVSADRLTPFRTVSGNQLETMVNYFWNIALCQALYPQLNMLEVATRNSLHSFLSTHFDRPDWYDKPNFLQRRELDDLAKAKRNILRTHASFRPGHVIAALRLLGKPPRFSLWRETLWATALGTIPKSQSGVGLPACSREPSALSPSFTWPAR